MEHNEDLYDADLNPIVERLRDERPQLTAIELDDVKRRVRARVAAAPARRRRRSEFMKSRLAILSMLVAGMLFSTTGAGLAISGMTGANDSAARGQYPGQNEGGIPLGEQKGPGGGGAPSGQNVGPAPSNQVLQPTRQVEVGTTASGGSQLPFTGFAAIPVLVGGVVLLTAGLVLRRRAQDA